MKWAPPLTALTLLVLLLALISSASASAPFQPAYDLISISDSTAGANADVVQRISVPAGDRPIGKITWSLPTDWDVLKVTKFAIVGSGQLQVDPDLCDGVVQTYALTILDTGLFLSDDPAVVETRWEVQGVAPGYPFAAFGVEITGSPAAGQNLEMLLFSGGTPSAPP